jgi:mannonate dehydratase
MVLLSHAGEEKAVHAKEAQALGNPLKLRRALDAGVRVVIAHCGSLGRNEDLDRPGQRASNFDLFLRLMSEERYRGLLFGDISAITQINRMPGPLRTILERPDLQDRLVNGSDYPLPGIPLLTLLQQFVYHGFVTKSEARALANVFTSNPLLADFLLKRTIRDPASGRGLDPRIFTGAALVGSPSASP